MITGRASSQKTINSPQLEISQTEAGPAGSLFEVTGRVSNPGQFAVTAVMVVVTTYDAEGQVTGFRQARLPDDLPPGADSVFSVSLMPNEDLPDSYNVAVQARLAGP